VAAAEPGVDLPRVGDPCRVAFDSTGRWLAMLEGARGRFLEVRKSEGQTRMALTSRPGLAACWIGRGRPARVGRDRSTREGEVAVWPEGERLPNVRRAVRLPEARLPVRMVAAERTGRGRSSHECPEKAMPGRLAWVDDEGVSLAGTRDLGARAHVPARDVQGLADDGRRLWLASGLEARCCLGESARPGQCWDKSGAEEVSGIGTLWCGAAGGRFVVVGGKDGIAGVLDADKADLLASERLSSAPVCSAALAADESMALLGCGDGSVKLLRLGVVRV